MPTYAVLRSSPILGERWVPVKPAAAKALIHSGRCVREFDAKGHLVCIFEPHCPPSDIADVLSVAVSPVLLAVDPDTDGRIDADNAFEPSWTFLIALLVGLIGLACILGGL